MVKFVLLLVYLVPSRQVGDIAPGLHRRLDATRRSSRVESTVWTGFATIQDCCRRILSPPQSNLGIARRSRTTTQQSPHGIGYNGMSQIYPQNCPFLFDDHHHYLIHPLLDQPHSPSQKAPGYNSRFATVHFQDRQSDRPTGGIDDMSERRALIRYW